MDHSPANAPRRTTALALLLLLSPVACRDPQSQDVPDGQQGSSPDARIARDAGPLVDAAIGTSGVSAIGRADRIDLVCWNVRQFPEVASTTTRLAAMIRDLDVDVVALFEIDDDAAFNSLLSLLPGWRGYLGGGDGYIKGALIWRDAQVTVTSLYNLFESDYDFPRPPIHATVGHGADSMDLIAVHLKAGRETTDAQRRANANAKLAGWLAARGNPKAIVCGDFNEDLDNAYAPATYAAWLAAPQTYHILTAALDHAGVETYLPATRVMFDQMISTVALDPELAGEAPLVPPLDRQVPDYQAVISDHLPVALHIDLH